MSTAAPPLHSDCSAALRKTPRFSHHLQGFSPFRVPRAASSEGRGLAVTVVPSITDRLRAVAGMEKRSG